MNPAKVSHLEFCEPQLAAGVALGKVFFVGRKLQRAVGQKRPAVVAAHKAPWVAALGLIDQRIAPVLANVIEGFDAAILLAHHQDLFAPHGLHLPVAGFGQLRLRAPAAATPASTCLPIPAP